MFNCEIEKRSSLFRISVKGMIAFVMFLSCISSQAQKNVKPPSPLFFQGGKMNYTPDERGNKVFDFSFCGYKGSEGAIPNVEVKCVVPLMVGDATPLIQAAIDKLSSMPLNKDGFRGTILLQAGTYHLKSSLKITQSGIVMRGAGMKEKGTVLMGEGIDRLPLIHIKGKDDRIYANETKVTNAYVAVGEKNISLADASNFKVGDTIVIHIPSTLNWIKTLGTDHFGGGITSLGWKPGERDLYYERKVIAADAKNLTLDFPIPHAIDSAYGSALVATLKWNGRINNIGIENISFVSSYDVTNEKDEDHCWNAINIEHAEDVWVRRTSYKNFAGSAVSVLSTSKRITVEDCISTHPVSEIGAQRRNTFFTSGQQTLFQRCYAENGYHDFAVGFCAAGPNAFVQCQSVLPYSFSGTIDSWATGVLFDVVNIDGNAIRFGNRGQDASGAGWSAANCLFWQCSAALIECPKPPTANNYAFGSWSQFSGNGYWENSNEHVQPRSLYYQQLKDRLGKDVNDRAWIMPVESEASSSPSVEVAAQLNARSFIPLLQLRQWIDSVSNINPIPNKMDYAIQISARDVMTVVHKKEPKLELVNGWLVRGNEIVTGGRQEVPWWNGGVDPKAVANAKPHITRNVPGRIGKGLTDDLDEMTDEMLRTNTLMTEHNYGLWYERRRDDHERIRRMDGEVWPPFYELPFARSGQSSAWDGLSKYDLSKYNKWYWLRLNQYANLADQKGLILLHQNYFQHNIIEAGAHYADFPWRTANNINNTGFPEPVPYAGDKRLFMDEQFYDIKDANRRKLHVAYINKCLDNFRNNNSIIQSLGAEYTGPLHFAAFWLDAVDAWQKANKVDQLIALSTTKDVQDSILADNKRSAVVDIIDIRYWHIQEDGKVYSPLGGQHLAPRQHARLLKPKRVSFESVVKALKEYRLGYPGKAVMFSADAYPQMAWAVLMGGGSMPQLPSTTDKSFLQAVSETNPAKNQNALIGKKDLIMYVDAQTDSNIDLSKYAGKLMMNVIELKTGKVVSSNLIDGGVAMKMEKSFQPSIVWFHNNSVK